MRAKFVLCSVSVSVFAALFVFSSKLVSAGNEAPKPGSPEFPLYVMNRIDDQYRGDKSRGTIEMTVKTKHWTRSITMESWTFGKDYSLMRILSPKKEMGNATLKSKDDLFTYLSKTGRTIKITSGMMGGSWMGSHFTNDDLIRHTRLDNDYKVELSFQGKADGVDVYKFTLFPKPDSAVVWGKQEITVRSLDLVPLGEKYFDEDGKAVRMLEFSNHKKVGDRVIPTKMVMKPLDGSSEYTMIEWKNIDFSVALDKDFFTIQKLKSM